MQLVLSLVLEHCDVLTLLDCLFIDKYTHSVVMRILNYELRLIRELQMLFNGDIYHGILAYMGEVSIIGRSKVFQEYPLRKGIRSDLMAIYTRLYMFDVVITSAYSVHHDHWATKIYIDDFGHLINKYWYKMSPDLIGVIFVCVYHRDKYCYAIEYEKKRMYLNIAKYILDKGFDVNQLINMGEGFKTTILNYSIRREDHELVELILDKNPDIFVYDKTGNNADSLFIYGYDSDGKYNKHRNEYNYHMWDIYDKFEELRKRQRECVKTVVWKK